MKNAVLVCRILLGLPFVFFSAAYFFKFMEPGEPPNPEAGAFMTALEATGYMMPMIKSVELLSGVLLILGWFVPMALVLLAPVTVNIVAFHAYLHIDGLMLAIPILLIHLFLAAAYGQSFAGVVARVPSEEDRG